MRHIWIRVRDHDGLRHVSASELYSDGALAIFEAKLAPKDFNLQDAIIRECLERLSERAWARESGVAS